MNRIALLSLILLTGLLGCSSSPSSAPQWSTGVAENYPPSRYLTAIGEANSREFAEQRALSALARVFEVNIQEQNSDFSLFQSGTGQESETINRQVNSRQLIASTEQVVEGAIPVEYWQNNQQHLVLVALERSGAEQRIRQQIGQLDQQTSALARYASNNQLNSVVQISALEQARQLQRQRIPLNRNLSVVSGKQISPPISAASLEQLIRNQLAELQFSLAAEPELLAQLEHAVGQIGASIQNEAELHLHGAMDREPIVMQQGWYWVRGSLQLALSNSDGTVIAQQRWPVKISAQEEGMVEQRLRDRINQDIANQLFQLVTSTQLDK
ncbi:MAG: LPP20 family lipoprotein [Halopseudomonas sp.]